MIELPIQYDGDETNRKTIRNKNPLCSRSAGASSLKWLLFREKPSSPSIPVMA